MKLKKLAKRAIKYGHYEIQSGEGSELLRLLENYKGALQIISVLQENKEE